MTYGSSLVLHVVVGEGLDIVVLVTVAVNELALLVSLVLVDVVVVVALTVVDRDCCLIVLIKYFHVLIPVAMTT